MVRITINAKRCAFSSKIEVDPEKWDNSTSKVKGRDIESKQTNNLLEEVRTSIHNTYYIHYNLWYS